MARRGGLLLLSALIVGLAIGLLLGAPTRPPAPTPTPRVGGGGVLSNGCQMSPRGIPACGTLFGSSLTANADPTAWEKQMGDHLGVRRTYYQASQVAEAVRQVKADLAAGRVPWISFKAPYSWPEMVAGRGDDWARDLATRLSRVDGPVWLAVHHEPEKDGDITLWTRMQERLAPLVRRIAPNVAYSVILTGWHSWHSPIPAYRIDSLFPDTKIDLVGFDAYNKYGNSKGGTTQTDMKTQFFDEIAPWARAHHVAWGIAETGYGSLAAENMPDWLSVTYDQMVAAGGVAMTYWNSARNTRIDYAIDTPAKQQQFTSILHRSPKLCPCSRGFSGPGLDG